MMRIIALFTVLTGSVPPQWSPSGGSIAFVYKIGKCKGGGLARGQASFVFTVDVDGSNLWRSVRCKYPCGKHVLCCRGYALDGSCCMRRARAV